MSASLPKNGSAGSPQRVAPDVEYDALLYSIVHAGNPGDLPFYLRRTEVGQHVLELGVGYGRVMSALAAADRRVTGLDLHTGLLNLARQKLAALSTSIQARVSLFEGDMTALDQALPSVLSFDAVIIPYSGLWCLLDDDAVRACLRGARRRLQRGGTLLLDAYAADGFHAECTPQDQSDAQLDEVCTIVAGDRAYDVYERSLWDRDRQRLLATYVYAATDGSERLSFSIDQRYLLRDQLERLLIDCGFAISHIWGDFDGAPYTPDSDILALEAVAC